LNNPQNLLDLFGNVQVPKYASLNECSCRSFNRKESSQRNNLEEAVINLVKINLSLDTPIHILSTGSGGCFGEAVYLSKFAIREGYENVKMTVIDKNYKNSLGPSNALKDFAESEITPLTGRKIEINSYSEIDVFIQDVTSQNIAAPNVLLAIDMDGAETEVLDQLFNKLSSMLFERDRRKKERTFLGATYRGASYALKYRTYIMSHMHSLPKFVKPGTLYTA
jgi:hypothetical protein